MTVNNRLYTEPAIVETPQKILSWLRQNAFPSTGPGWFGVGYGAFRRLTRGNQIIVPSLSQQARFTNFYTQFVEDEALSSFEQWMVYLDYRIAKGRDSEARHQRQIGVRAINAMLPLGSRFDHVSPQGRIVFDVNGTKVPTLGLSDGFRSILALTGDLVWRLIQAFPTTKDPFAEEGVVLIDELDIHLHPLWQREIAARLMETFPKLQFIVATHSPLIASGAGEDALTLKIFIENGRAKVEEVMGLAALRVDHVLESEAFCLVSPFSPQTQKKINRYDNLSAKKILPPEEKTELRQLQLFMRDAMPFRETAEEDALSKRISNYLTEHIDD